MDFLTQALKALPTVAKSPLALVAFIVVVLAWLILGLKVNRNRNVLKHLKDIPAKDRLAALEAEIGRVRIKSGLTADEYLRSRIHQYWLIGSIVLCLMIAVLFTLALSARGAKIAEFSGTLGAPSRVLLSGEKRIYPKIQIGDSSTILEYPDPPPDQPIFRFFDDNILRIKVESGQIKVSGLIRNPQGNVMAELVDNEWKVNPNQILDRNYAKHALEVRDQTGDVVLQVRVIEDRIQLQFKAYGPDGGAVVMAKNPKGPGGFLSNEPLEVRHLRINPIFKYPSDLHLGEFK